MIICITTFDSALDQRPERSANRYSNMILYSLTITVLEYPSYANTRAQHGPPRV